MRNCGRLAPGQITSKPAVIGSSAALLPTNALVLTGPANFRVAGQVARSAETRDQANGERKLHPALLAPLQDTMIFEVAMPDCFASSPTLM
jgi:hypothetical protein